MMLARELLAAASRFLTLWMDLNKAPRRQSGGWRRGLYQPYGNASPALRTALPGLQDLRYGYRSDDHLGSKVSASECKVMFNCSTGEGDKC